MAQINVGIVGYGFVGKAVAYGFREQNLFIADPVVGTSTKDLLDKKLDVVFICVSTPMGANGEIDISNVAQVLFDLSKMSTLLVLKSTVTPKHVEFFSKKYYNFVYNPEFLTERNALWDFENPISNVYGGDRLWTQELEEIYKNHSTCQPANTFHMSAVEASFVKYAMNSYLASKVVFFNQLHDLVDSTGYSFENVRAAVANDSRIGDSHTNVPGFDGRKGTSGPCFGKDVPAFIRYSQEQGKELTVLKETWNVNCDYRNAYSAPLPREQEQHIEFNKIV